MSNTFELIDPPKYERITVLLDRIKYRVITYMSVELCDRR